MKSYEQATVKNLEDYKTQTDETERLRSLVLGEKYQAALDSLLSHEEDEDRVADVISEAVRKRNLRDTSVAESLAPIVDSALQNSIDKNPKRIINVIYPILGPAIRKAVAVALADMVQSLNKALEQSFNVKSVWWRIQAKRAGMPYAQYVLLKTLRFRVEQVLLVHRETGLLLHHVAQSDVQTQDPELVSSMLTAITNFVSDSFSNNSTDTLDGIRFGEFQLYVDIGPEVILATLVRGSLTNPAHVQILETLESIHSEFDIEVKSFDGNRTNFDETESSLKQCLLSQSNDDRSSGQPAKKFPAMALAVIGLVFGLFVYWGYIEYQVNTQIKEVVEQLNSEPGYVLVNRTRDGRNVEGTVLRDPTSRPISTVKDELEVTAISLTLFEQLIYFETPEVAARLSTAEVSASIEKYLTDLDQVQLSVENGGLKITGVISQESLNGILTDSYINELLAQIDVSGVDIFPREDMSTAVYLNSVSYQQLLTDITKQTFYFLTNSTEFAAGGEDVLVELVGLLRQLMNYHAEYNLPSIELLIIGFSDSRGTEVSNQRISQQRADRVKELLLANDIDATMIVSWGAGNVEGSSLNQQSQRRVSISISSEISAAVESENL